VNMRAQEFEHPSPGGNATSQRFRHSLEQTSPQGSTLGVGDTLQAADSALASSIASNLPEKHAMSSNNSQLTGHTGSTPPTSSSAPSSQDHPTLKDRICQLGIMSEATTKSGQDGVLPRVMDHSESQSNALRIHTTPTSPTTASFPSQMLSHGQKRTASGQTKPSSSSLPTSPVEGAVRGHSRNTSVNSSGTQIGEVGWVVIIDDTAILLI